MDRPIPPTTSMWRTPVNPRTSNAWQPPSGIWGLLLAYSVTASVLAFLLWYRGISQVAASIAGLFTGLLPISAASVAMLALAEPFSGWYAVALSFVLPCWSDGAH